MPKQSKKTKVMNKKGNKKKRKTFRIAMWWRHTNKTATLPEAEDKKSLRKVWVAGTADREDVYCKSSFGAQLIFILTR